MLDYRMDTFLTLCDTMNYREAAGQLHITQPAVTQHIQFLERAYGCALFTYQNRTLEKTPQELTLERYARAMRANDRDVRRQLAGGGVQALRIGATKTIGDYVLPEQIERFLKKKQAELTLLVDNTEHLLRLLDEDRLDFAIVEGFFDKARYDSRCLREEPFVGVCPKEHRFAGREVTIRELLEETIIHREDGSGTRAILEQQLRSCNESLSRFAGRICISSFKLIGDLVRKGFGVSFVYKVLADSDPALATFTLSRGPIVRQFNLVWLPQADVQRKIELFFS